MEKKVTRKPFVVPRLQSQASLAGVTLISGSQGPVVSRRIRKGSNLAYGQGSSNRNA